MNTAAKKPDDLRDDESQGRADGKKPVHVVSYSAGKDTHIQASIWERTVQNGTTSFNVYDVSLRKRVKVNDGWKSIYTFRGSEIPFVVRALDRAEEWILEQTRTDNVPPF
jgi:hypothetical protein